MRTIRTRRVVRGRHTISLRFQFTAPLCTRTGSVPCPGQAAPDCDRPRHASRQHRRIARQAGRGGRTASGTITVPAIGGQVRSGPARKGPVAALA